ncbi:putative peroxiredoxin pmp20 [Delphinella strobiligena]|nr:putative peroxiredoxin pmp20 [Delphinella strobiligena]
MPLSVGDKFPEGVKFDWAPILDDDPTVCGLPQKYDASKEWKGKKVVLVSLPGAFTPTCSSNHLPPFAQRWSELKAKGVDKFALIAFNDAFVMNGWGKVLKVPQGEDFLLLGDTDTKFSEKYGWNLGERTGRWAMIIEKDGTISYAENEKHPQATEVSGVEAVLKQL